MLRRAWIATQDMLLEFCQPVGTAFGDGAKAASIYTIMMLS